MRLRITYTKEEPIKYISHLDMVRMFDRAIRRSGIPIAYSQGFNPHPQISYGPPLPVGIASSAEVLDITLTQALPPSAVKDPLQKTVAPGVTLLSVETVDDRAPALTEFIDRATYEAEFEETKRQLISASIAHLLSASELPLTRVKKGKPRTDDIRPSIIGLRVETDRPIVSMELRIGSEGNIKPMDVTQLLPDIHLIRYRRTRLFHGA